MKRKMQFKGPAFDSLLLAIVKVATTLVGIACTMVLSRCLSLDAYGTYSQGNLVISVATSLTVLGLSDASNYFFNREGGSCYVSNIFAIQIVVGAVSFVAILLGQGPICDYFGNAALGAILVCVALRPFVNNVLASLQVLIVSMGMARLLAVRNAVVSVAKVVTVSTVALVCQDIALIFIAYLLVDVANAVWFLVIYIRRCGLPRLVDLDFRAAGKILVFAIPMAVSVGLATFSREMAKLVVGNLDSTANFAIFANCSAQLPLDFVASSFLTVLMPMLTRFVVEGEVGKARELYAKYIEVGYLLVWPLAFCLMFLSEESVFILYGERYLAGAPIFAIYLVTYATTFFSSTLVLSASGKTRVLMRISGVAIVVNFALCFLLYRAFGMYGTAAGSVIANLGMATATFLCSSKALGGRPVDLLQPRVLARTLGILITLCLALWPVRCFLVNGGLPSLAIALIIGAVYIGAFYLLSWRHVVELLRSINRMR